MVVIFVSLRVAFDSVFLSGLDPKRYYLRFVLELIRAFFLILLCLAIASVHPKNRQILKRYLKTLKLWRRLLEVCGSHRYCRQFSVQAKLVRLVGSSARVCFFFLVDNALAKVCQQQPICSVAVSVFLVRISGSSMALQLDVAWTITQLQFIRCIIQSTCVMQESNMFQQNNCGFWSAAFCSATLSDSNWQSVAATHLN